jgi:hypothetical protein
MTELFSYGLRSVSFFQKRMLVARFLWSFACFLISYKRTVSIYWAWWFSAKKVAGLSKPLSTGPDGGLTKNKCWETLSKLELRFWATITHIDSVSSPQKMMLQLASSESKNEGFSRILSIRPREKGNEICLNQSRIYSLYRNRWSKHHHSP